MVNLNDITLNKWLCDLTSMSFEMSNFSYTENVERWIKDYYVIAKFKYRKQTNERPYLDRNNTSKIQY